MYTWLRNLLLPIVRYTFEFFMTTACITCNTFAIRMPYVRQNSSRLIQHAPTLLDYLFIVYLLVVCMVFFLVDTFLFNFCFCCSCRAFRSGHSNSGSRRLPPNANPESEACRAPQELSTHTHTHTLRTNFHHVNERNVLAREAVGRPVKVPSFESIKSD